MEIFIITALILYMAFKDVAHFRERETLQKMLMSKSLADFVEHSEEPENENTVTEEDPIIPIEQATLDQIMKARDNT